MGTLALLVFVMLMAQHKKAHHPTGHAIPSTTSAAEAAAAAQAAAAAAAARAAQTNHPDDHAQAAQAAHTANVLVNHAKAQQAAAKLQPPPWPQAVPSGLPPWPTGWKPASPPPAAVVSRAWQLLPTLWKSGAGTKKFENTGGQWYAYVASPMGSKKGVTAWKPSGVVPATKRQPSGNA